MGSQKLVSLRSLYIRNNLVIIGSNMLANRETNSVSKIHEKNKTENIGNDHSIVVAVKCENSTCILI